MIKYCLLNWIGFTCLVTLFRVTYIRAQRPFGVKESLRRCFGQSMGHIDSYVGIIFAFMMYT